MSFHPPEFFKIMQNHEEKLRLPKNFVDNYWKGISNPVVLGLPNGAQQEIFWVEHDGDIWFKKNWEKFAKFLKFGYAVVFKYKGGSYFKVKIFGLNTLEIDYSNIKCVGEVGDESVEEVVEVNGNRDECETSKQAQRIKVNGKRKVDMDFEIAEKKFLSEFCEESVEVSDDSDKSLDEGEVTKNKKWQEKNYNGVETSKEAKEFVEVSDESYTQTQRTKKGKRKMNVDFDATQQKIICANKGSMTKKAKKCPTTSNENPYFELKLTPSYIEGHNTLKIPSEFSRKYLSNFKGIATIRVGEDMPVELKMSFDNIHRRSIVTGGWKSFSQKYNLQVGDVCKFEMTRSKPLSFAMTITIAKENPNSKKSQGSEGDDVMKHDTFEICVNFSYPHVPSTFLDRHRECHGKFVELKVDGKSWLVKVSYYSKCGSCRFCYGWTKFVKDCKLKIGDSCLFELIDEEKLVFKVSFVRKNP